MGSQISVKDKQCYLFLVSEKHLTDLFAQIGVAQRPCGRHHSAAIVRAQFRGQLFSRELGGPGQRREGREVRGQSRDLDLVLQLAQKLGTAQLGPAGDSARAGVLHPVFIHRLTETQGNTR